MPKDFYPTPREAVLPLIPHLLSGSRYTEPCVGTYDLVRHLDKFGFVCSLAYDEERDARVCKDFEGDLFITNPPWDRKVLHPIIENLSDVAPTWLLFDADWMHTKQSHSYLDRLCSVVSVGRVKWIPDSKMTGKDNCCWYLFSTPDPLRDTIFYGR